MAAASNSSTSNQQLTPLLHINNAQVIYTEENVTNPPISRRCKEYKERQKYTLHF